MHGSVGPARAIAGDCDVHELEATSGRSALHKAAFWGHKQMIAFLLGECRLNANVQDNYGDTALHDAARFGHAEVVDQVSSPHDRCSELSLTEIWTQLLAAGADTSLKNEKGEDAITVARNHGYNKIAAAIARGSGAARSRL